jgi:hypothetical protein
VGRWRSQEGAGLLSSSSVIIKKASVVTLEEPRLRLLGAQSGAGQQHGTLEAVLKLQLETDRDASCWDIEFILSAPAQVVVGSSDQVSKPRIELASALRRPIDVLLELKRADVQVTGWRSMVTTKKKVEETFEGVGAHGQNVTETTVQYEESVTKHPLAGYFASMRVPLCLTAARFSLRTRDTSRAPRRDA